MSDDCGTIVERLDSIEDCLAEQRVWNERVAGADGSNGRLGIVRKIVDRALAGVIGSVVIAGLAIYTAGVKKGVEEADIRALKSQVESNRQQIQQLQLTVIRLLPTTFSPAPSAPSIGDEP